MPSEYYNPRSKQKKRKPPAVATSGGSFAFDGVSPYELQIDVINNSLKARGKKRIKYKRASDKRKARGGNDGDDQNRTRTLLQSAIIRSGNADDEVYTNISHKFSYFICQ